MSEYLGMILTCVSLMAKTASIFSCTYLPSEYFPCWSVCANLWPNFQRSFLKFWVPFWIPDILGVRSLSYAWLSRTVKRWEFLPLTSWQAHLPQGAGAWRPGAQRQRTAAPNSVCGVTFVFMPVPWPPRSHRSGSGGPGGRWGHSNPEYFIINSMNIRSLLQRGALGCHYSIKKMQGTVSNKYISAPPFFFVFHRT